MGIEKRAAFAKREASTPGRASYCTAREFDSSESGKKLKNRKKNFFINKKKPHFFQMGAPTGYGTVSSCGTSSHQRIATTPTLPISNPISNPLSTTQTKPLSVYFWWLVDSLQKHMQNEKELIRLRRFLPAARTTRARSAQFRLRRELPCTRVVQFCLRRKLPAPGTKGGLFCICVESRNLT